MELSIGQALARGFRLAVKGWPGIAVYAAGSLLIGLIVIGSVMLTGIPSELSQGPTLGAGVEESPVERPARALRSKAEEAVTAPADATAEGTVDAAGETATEAAVAAEEAGEPVDEAVSTGTDVAADLSDTGMQGMDDLGNDVFDDTGAAPTSDWEDAAFAWLARAWPVMLFSFLFAMLAGLFLNGGQIGYVGQLEATEQSSLPAFLASAKRSFVSLLGAWAISTGAVIGAALAIGLLAFILGLMTFLPGALLAILGVILGIAATAGLVWLAVRLVFWFPAIVLDGLGPIEGLRASFAVTKGRWLKVFLLGVVVALVSMGVGLIFQVLGAAGGIVNVLVTIISLFVNLYMGFALLAVYVSFYRGLKTGRVAGGAKAA